MAKGRRSVKNKKNNLITIIVVILTLAVLGIFFYKVIWNKPNLLSGYSLYETEKYTIQYKSDWTSSVNDTNPNMTVFLSQNILNSNSNTTVNSIVNDTVQNNSNTMPTVSNAVQNDSTTPNELGIINVITEDLTTYYTLDQYVNDSINNLKSTFNLEDSNIR